MKRSGFCINAKPTLLYSEMPLTEGKAYLLETDTVPGHVLVMDPDPDVIHEVLTQPKTGEYIHAGESGIKVLDEDPKSMVLVDAAYTRTGNTSLRARGPMLVTADRFQLV